jgi:hypothetical protein
LSELASETTRNRSEIVSSFTIIKGAMISETYAALGGWDLAKSKADNLRRLRETNFIGASTETWLRDVAKVLNRRLDPDGRDRPLVVLAHRGCDVALWKPILLWHITRDEFLLRDFLTHWLYAAYDAGAYRVRPEELHQYLERINARGGATEHPWTEATLKRVAAGLLKMASDFGLLKGSVVKEFDSYHLPEQSFLYLVHAMYERTHSPRKIVESNDWRMYLMRPEDVERELLHLHQFRRLEYHVAGSLVQLKLPFATASEYAERMVA